MNREMESLNVIKKYLERLGYPLETILSEYPVPESAGNLVVFQKLKVDLVVKTSNKVVIAIEVTGDDLDAIQNDKLFPKIEVIKRLQGVAMRLNAPIYILSNGQRHIWFINDKNGQPIQTNEQPYSTLQLSYKQDFNVDKEEIRKLVDSLKCNFYFAESYDNSEHSIRFFLDGKWKVSNGIRHSKEIAAVEIGDIIILKSKFYISNRVNSKISGIGRVLANDKDGKELKIDWKVKNINKNIRSIGKSDEFSKLSKKEINLVIENIGIDTFINAGLFDPLPSTTSKIAGLVSDSEKGIDYLDISKDVSAFARVIAAKSFEPPLAIALFGKWGSGKSFFMRKLKEQIDYFSKNSLNGIYCEGVVHIHFNAWSYMDANLWASIVTRIFEGLNEYISKNSKTDLAKKEIEKQLTNTLTIAKEEIGALETKKNVISGEIKTLEKKREEVSNEIGNKIKKIQANTVFELIKNADEQFGAKEKIIQSLRANDSFIDSEQEVKRVVPEKYWNNPEVAYKEIKSTHAFLKQFFRRDKVGKNLLWLIIILTIVFLTPILLALASDQIKGISFAIPQAALTLLVLAGSAWKRGELVYNQLQPVIASFWKIKEDYQKHVREAVAKFEQEEKALNLEIDKGKSELLLVEQQIQKAESIKADLELRINSALATETLYSFIDRRSSSDDYKKQLGIISIIRNDLEILNDLFYQHNQEASKAEEAEKFREKFKKPLERIILYIDDLDRCPEENVVQVLEAVNLLMAFPLFVVIVGVDSRWVKNALIKKHALQFTGRLNEDGKTEDKIELIEASNYLEKIFQIPFHLKGATDVSIKDMIKKLAGTAPVVRETVENDTYRFEPTSKPLADSFEENNNTNAAKEQTGKSNSQTGNVVVDKPEALILTEQEVVLMQDMSEVIGNNPRAIKRFVNIYRIIKAHEEFSYDTELSEKELAVILFLLALPLGHYKKLLPSLEAYLQSDKNETNFFTFYLQPSHTINNDQLNDLKNKLYATLSDKHSFYELQNAVVAAFKKHNEFIKRFTFKNL